MGDVMDFGANFGDFGKFPGFSTGFHFKSANDLFNEFFQKGFFDDDDDFNFLRGNFSNNGTSRHGSSFHPTSNFDQNIETSSHKKRFTNFPAFDDDAFFSGGFTGGNFGTSKSVSTTTKTIGGKTVTVTKTRIQDSNGNVTEEVKEESIDEKGNREIKYLQGGDGTTKNLKKIYEQKH